MTLNDHSADAALEKVLREHGLARDSRLYREATRDSLTPTDTADVYRLAANTHSTDSVIDIYGQGYMVQAEEVGPGLSFAESATPDWQETMEMRVLQAKRGDIAASAAERVEVEVHVEDILRQGGRIYPVQSVTVERAWYCTLPSGSVEVRAIT
jgi:hypothetical protein